MRYSTTAGAVRVLLFDAHEPERHVLVARLVEHVGVHARLQLVLGLQLLGRLRRGPSRLVVDHESFTGPRGVGRKQVDGAFGERTQALRARREERDLGAQDGPRRELRACGRRLPTGKRGFEALALPLRNPPVPAERINRLARDGAARLDHELGGGMERASQGGRVESRGTRTAGTTRASGASSRTRTNSCMEPSPWHDPSSSSSTLAG